jgi:hypothetical protein
MHNASSADGIPANNSDANNRESSRPEWVRIPRPGFKCSYSGLSRAHLHRLLRDGEVESISLRKRGAKFGVRLISYDSLMAYIRTAGEPGSRK